MLGLPLGVGFAHRRTGQPITQVQLMKQPLALPHAQLNLVSLLQPPRQVLPSHRLVFRPASVGDLRIIARTVSICSADNRPGRPL